MKGLNLGNLVPSRGDEQFLPVSDPFNHVMRSI